MNRIALSAVAVLVLGAGVSAEEIDLPHITVSGTATTEVTPDQMVWSLKVQNKGASLEEVAQQHTDIVNRVLQFLKQSEVEEKTIQTSWMQFGENWVYRNRSRVKEGYYASTILSFKVKDLKKYKPLWIGLSRIERVSVEGVRYDHSKRIQYQDETRVKALLAAKQKAVNMARILGSRVGEPLAIEEDLSVSEGRAVPSFSNVAVNAGAAGTAGEGIAPGKIPVRIRVKVKFRLITPDK